MSGRRVSRSRSRSRGRGRDSSRDRPRSSGYGTYKTAIIPASYPAHGRSLAERCRGEADPPFPRFT